MANLKDIRNRIGSVTSMKQITSAMKMVSAAKLRRAQDAIIQLRPYANKMTEILHSLSNSLSAEDESPYLKIRQPNRILMVLISSNRGLAGAFNSNVIKNAMAFVDEKYGKQMATDNVDFMAIGKKGFDQMRRKKLRIIANHSEVYNALHFENVAAISQEIMDSFVNGRYDRVHLLYNSFKNVAVHPFIQEQFLPVVVEDKEEDEYARNYDYIFEPSPKEIVETLIPTSLRMQFYKAILDSNAAEHGARMTSMHQATDNATDILKDLKLTYNKARQAAITKEIIEISAGAEALSN